VHWHSFCQEATSVYEIIDGEDNSNIKQWQLLTCMVWILQWRKI